MENHRFSWVYQLSMAIFNSKLLVYQRVCPIQSHKNHNRIPMNHHKNPIKSLWITIKFPWITIKIPSSLVPEATTAEPVEASCPVAGGAGGGEDAKGPWDAVLPQLIKGVVHKISQNIAEYSWNTACMYVYIYIYLLYIMLYLRCVSS